MNKTKFFCFLLLIIVGHLQAQKKGFSEGYVVTFQNDTIHGLIKSKNKVSSGKSVSFISDSGDKIKYKPRDIKLYSKTRKTYRSFQLPIDMFGFSGHAFLQEIIIGRVNLYKYCTYDQLSGMNADGQQTYGGATTVDNYYLEKEDSKEMVKVNPLKFKNQLSEFFNDDPELSGMISNKEYRFDDIEAIVKIYNEGK